MIPDNLNDTTIGEFLCKSWTSSTFEFKLRRTHAVLLTHYLLWFLGVLLIYSTDHVILPQDTPTRYFKQHTAAQTFERSSSRPSCMMDSVSTWWERVILFVRHAFSFRFFSLKSHLRLPVFSGYKNYVKALQRTLGYYHGQLMYFVKVNVVIHVYKPVQYWTHTGGPGAVQYQLGCISLRYVLLRS